MLTNNKNFVRSIAMLLAVLMVMALCLTGCGNKAADEALTKAEEAKTAADAVAEALDGYVSKEDKATVKALVIEALGDDYATAAEIDALAEKLAAYVTADDVSKMIKDEMAKYALDKLKGELMTKDDVLKILENYYTKAEIDEKFKNIWGEFSAAEVQAILKDAMSLKEWDKTSDVVLTTIEYLQVLLKSLDEETYTQANMKKVNECLAPFGIVAFKDGADADTRLDELKGNDAAIAEVAKLLEYTILRQATLEDMAELKAAVDAAVAVPTFEKSFAKMKADLYGLGDLYVVGNYDGTNDAFKADKYNEYNLSYYHETAVKGTDQAKVQIVTLADKAGFHAFANAHDALLAEYYADKTSAEGSDGWMKNLTVYTLYEVSETVAGVTTKHLETKASGAAPANSTVLGKTMLSMANAADAVYLNKVYQNKTAENEVLLFPLYDVDPNGLAIMNVTTDFEDTNTFPIVVDDLACAQSGDGVWATTYTLVWVQLNLVQAFADLANDLFQGGVKTVNNPLVSDSDLEDDSFFAVSFLKDTIYNNTDSFLAKNYNNITDAEFLAALTAEMCEPVVPGVYDYPVYLMEEVELYVELFKMMNGQAYDPTVGGFDKWDLYEKMMDKTFDLLWDKYKKQAADWANVILKDYISVAYEAVANTVGNTNTIGVNYTDKGDLVDAMNNALALGGLTTAETITEDELTDGFLAAFLTGDNTLLADSYIYDALELTDKFEKSNLLAFYLNNGAAKVSTTKVDDLTASAGLVYANPLASIAKDAENIRQRLTGSMIYTELAIARADKDTYKASGVSVREAFYGLLKEGVENLDEIYARFLLEDYKKMTYNEMAVKAEKIVTFYNKGVADAAQTAAIERYLTGVATAATTEDDILVGINAPKNATSKKITSVTYKANDLEDTLTNGFLTTNIGAVTVNVFATSSGAGTDKVAAEAMKKIDAFAAEATTTIENVLVKALFLNYLWEARGNLAAANITYGNYVEDNFPTAWNVSIQLMEANNTADNQITVVEFFHNRGDYKLADYKTAYVDEVLKLVADKDNMHVALLSGKSIDDIVALDDAGLTKLVADTFKAKLAAVKSSANKTWVVGKYSPYTALADYYYIGEYAVDLDKILNTMDGRATTYRDNSGTHKLY